MWRTLLKELVQRTPVILYKDILYKLVQAAITRQKKKPCLSDIGIVIAVILKHRNKFLAQAQGIVSALLYTGHSSKQVSSTWFAWMQYIYFVHCMWASVAGVYRDYYWNRIMHYTIAEQIAD